MQFDAIHLRDGLEKGGQILKSVSEIEVQQSA
jgi:hypothetical protein